MKRRGPQNNQEETGWKNVSYDYDVETSTTWLEDHSRPLEPKEMEEVMRDFTATTLASE